MVFIRGGVIIREYGIPVTLLIMPTEQNVPLFLGHIIFRGSGYHIGMVLVFHDQMN